MGISPQGLATIFFYPSTENSKKHEKIVASPCDFTCDFTCNLELVIFASVLFNMRAKRALYGKKCVPRIF